MASSRTSHTRFHGATLYSRSCYTHQQSMRCECIVPSLFPSILRTGRVESRSSSGPVGNNLGCPKSGVNEGSSIQEEFRYLGYPSGTRTFNCDTFLRKIPSLLRAMQTARRLRHDAWTIKSTIREKEHILPEMDRVALEDACENRRRLEVETGAFAFISAFESVQQRLGELEAKVLQGAEDVDLSSCVSMTGLSRI